jgi:hypothetical protein
MDPSQITKLRLAFEELIEQDQSCEVVFQDGDVWECEPLRIRIYASGELAGSWFVLVASNNPELGSKNIGGFFLESVVSVRATGPASD